MWGKFLNQREIPFFNDIRSKEISGFAKISEK